MNELVIPKNLKNYVESRKKIISLHRQARKFIELSENECKQCGHHLFPSEGRIKISENQFIKDLDCRLWLLSFDKTGFYKLMDATAKSEFESELYNNPPEFTLENIKGTFLALFQKAEFMFKRGIVNVFKSMSKKYATNSKEPFKISTKNIIENMFDQRWGSNSGLKISYRKEATINDIDRVIKTLDKVSHTPRELEFLINEALGRGEIYEDDYYSIKGFRNGNAHIKIKRKDLVDKINKLVSEYYNESALGCYPK